MKWALTSILFVLCMFPPSVAAGLPFIEDRYEDALAQAKQRRLPMFVECWAPW